MKTRSPSVGAADCSRQKSVASTSHSLQPLSPSASSGHRLRRTPCARVAGPFGLFRLSVLALALVVAVGCQSVGGEAPAGFATFADSNPLRAVSANGVMYRVRTEPNEPAAELPFWREALTKRMQDAGYAFVSDDDLEGKHPGYLIELAAPVGQQDYSYLVAIFVRGDSILIAEAAGEVTRLAEHREAIVAAMRTVE